MPRSDVIAGAVLLAVGTLALALAAALPWGSVRHPGQGFFPWWMALGLAATGTAVLTGGLLSRRLGNLAGRASRAAPAGAPGGRGTGDGSWRRARRPLLLAGALAVCVLLLDAVGWVPAAFLAALACTQLAGRRPWAGAIVFAALLAVASYVVFALWLGIPLPRGSVWR